MTIPSRQKPGGEVARTKPTETPRSARQHKPDGPSGMKIPSHQRGKGQK